MSERIIKFTNIRSLESLKRDVLDNLRIRDFKKDCIPEFEIRLKRYLVRNPHQLIILKIDIENTKVQIEQRVSEEIKTVRYPDGFQFGQPNMMWSMEHDVRSTTEIEDEKSKIKIRFESEFVRFKNGLLQILQIGNGQIRVA